MLARIEGLALANLFSTRSGRRDLAALGVTVASIAFGAAIVSHRFFGNEDLVAMIRDDESGTLVRMFLGLAFAPGLFTGFAMAVQLSRAGLFERGEAALVLVSPTSRSAMLTLVFWRSLVATTIFALPMTILPVGLMARSLELGAGPVALALPALVLSLAFPIAAVIAANVALLRFLASPRVKFAVHMIVGLLATGGAVLGMTAFVIDEDDVLRIAETAAARAELPLLLETAAALTRPIESLAEPSARNALLAAPVFLLAAFALLRIAGLGYARAYENSIVAARPVFRSRAGGTGAPWPTAVATSIARRELAEVQRDPGGFFAYLFLAVFVVAATVLDFGKGGGGTLPPDVNRTFTLTTQWLLFSVIVSMLLTPSLTMGDRAQRPLLACSPASRPALLAGRLPGLVSIYAWVLLVQIVSSIVVGDPALVILALTAVATACTIFCIGLTLGFGTLTTSWLSDDGSAPGDMVAVVLPQLLVCGGTITLFFAMGRARSMLKSCYANEGAQAGVDPTTLTLAILGGALATAIFVALLGFALGARNQARALAPR